ncbi:hypothetical protein [Candidatus Poriferisocius sp.]|uniref:hypothetical protein n=1 Tax=Candidatus Poriferisocius sp. TaxID=3101276 RepID=UPI003B5B8480
MVGRQVEVAPGEGEEFAAAQQGVVGEEDHGDVGTGALLGLLRGFQSPSGLVVSGREGGGCDGFDLVSPQRFGLFWEDALGSGVAGDSGQ